ncbi:PREDICTED: putative vomeronasal receptor-like protein 4 [Condylura cristata]|uniref:putative vomeronasal receptor-like protein 4 n=1 Tax=Condylura cristata TaxID=143302 RepID=UPI00033471AB|nr:PREDICTED: putative vomeronasal receptor-like protein 4 [Condylura cristata]
MLWSTVIQGLLFFSVLGHGIMGNLFLLGGHLYTFIMSPEKKPIELIHIHLFFANALICTNAIIDIITILKSQDFLSDIGCKILIFLRRVARGLSICTTCLLSVVQAITISPQTSPFKKLQPRSAWQVLPCLLLFWVFNVLVSSNLLLYITTVQSTNSSKLRPYIEYCDMLPSGQTVRWLFLMLMAVRDVVFQGLMGWSSSYMAFRLCQHRKRVLHLHTSRLPGNASPETRATQSILMLMACFLFFYWADFLFSFYTGSLLPNNYTVYRIKIYLTSGYASLCPLVLLSRHVHVAKCWPAQ